MLRKLSLFLFLAGSLVPAQEDRVRAMWNTELRKQRQTAAVTAVAPAPTPVPKLPVRPSAAKPAPVLVGVTVWHLRPSTPRDPATVRAIVHEKRDQPHTPVRVSATTRFFEGDHLRITIESGRTGYLYVLSRERYADGTHGEASLIFPTSRLRGGDARVRAGIAIEIPASTDDPSYFTLKRSRAGHIGEELFFVVAPQPIPEVRITDTEVPVSNAMLETWRTRWGAQVESLESTPEAGKPITEQEVKLLRAGTGFQSEDPLPHTLYRAERSGDEPMLVALQLRMGQ